MLRLTAIAFLLIGVVQPAHAAPATQPAAAAVELPQVIRDALEQGAKQLDPVSISFTMQSSSTFTPEQAKEKLKLDEWNAAFNASAKQEYRFSWQEGKYYSRFYEGPWPGKPESHVAEQLVEGACDGTTLYAGDTLMIPRQPGLMYAGDTVFKIPLELAPTKQYRLDFRGFANGAEFFSHAGWVMPATIGDLKDKTPPQSRILHELANDYKLAAIDEVDLDGRKVIRLRLEAPDPDRTRAERADTDKIVQFARDQGIETEEQIQARVDAILAARRLPAVRAFLYYLDPSLGYAMCRYEERYNDGPPGTLLKRIDCEDFRKLDGRSISLPHRCVISHHAIFSMPGSHFDQPVAVQTYQLTELSTKLLPESKFVLNFTKPQQRIIEIIDSDDTQRVLEINDDGTVREVGR